MWSPIRVGRMKVCRRVSGTTVSIVFSFFSCAFREGREGSDSLLSNYMSAQGWGGLSFDDPLETLMWGRVF